MNDARVKPPPAHPTTLSVVMPIYNEARRLPQTLAQLAAWLPTQTVGGEVVFVDDGSTDGSPAIIERFIRGFGADSANKPEQQAAQLSSRDDARDAQTLHSRWTLRLLAQQANRGKGYACRVGALAATCNDVLLCDADLSCPLSELPKLAAYRARGVDVVSASRNLSDARLDPPQPPLRRWSAAVFRAVRRRLLLPEILDTQCGFKLMSRDAARAAFDRVRENGWLFDCELLATAAKLGYDVAEVGVHWRNDLDSRVRPLRVALTAIPKLLAIRARVRRLSADAPR